MLPVAPWRKIEIGRGPAPRRAFDFVHRKAGPIARVEQVVLAQHDTVARIVHKKRDWTSVRAVRAEGYCFGVSRAGAVGGKLNLPVRTHQAAIDSERKWRGGGAERRGLETFVRLNDGGRDLSGQRALPFEVAAVGGNCRGARSREDVEGGRGMGVSGANQDRIGGDAGVCGDALADVVGDANPDRENVNAGDCDFRAAVLEHERIRGEVVVHAGVAADATAVAEHREADGRIELYSRGAGVEGTHR